MSKPIPPVQKFMTSLPHTIAQDQPLSTAHKLMRQHAIRHLPVMGPEGLVGVVSDGDLRLVETLRDVDPTKLRVDEAMSQDVYAVDASTLLDEVLSTMAERKLGSAVVMSNGKVVGMFTTVDVCRAFAEMLHTRLA